MLGESALLCPGECMLLRSLCVISFMTFSLFASAHNFTLGQRVAPVGVDDKGELNDVNDTFSYTKWNSARLPGKVRIVQHMAGRSSAKALNEPLIEAIKAANLPHDRSRRRPSSTLTMPLSA